VTVRHVVLTASGLAVLGLGIYLFLEVRAAPATAQVIAKRPAAARTEQVVPEPAPEEPSEDAPPRSGRSRIARPAQPPVRDVTRTASDTAAPEGSGDSARLVNLDKDATMAEANKAYDRGDFAEAQVIAEKVLKDDPTNVRMLRIMVSSSCIEGDSVVAQTHYLKLPPPDREQMRTRCGRYGVSFNEQ
jgi:hypothetical protein